MKRIILILGALLLLLNSQAQNKWVTQIDTMGYHPIKMIQCKNGDLLCLGLTDHYQDSNIVTNKLHIARLNSETGAVIWERKFNVQFINIMEIENEELLLLTYILDTIYNQVYLYKFDKYLTTIDSNLLKNDSIKLIRLINRFQFNNYIRQYNDKTYPIDSTYIIKINDHLTEIDSVKVGRTIYPYTAIKENVIVILDINLYSFIECGSSLNLFQKDLPINYYSLFDFSSNYILTGIKNAGLQATYTIDLYTKYYEPIFSINAEKFTRSGFTDSDFQAALFTPDGKITLVGTFINPFAKVKFIQKINLDGSLDGPYKMMWGVGASHLTTVLPADDGGLYFFGGTDPGRYNYQYVYKSDLCGDVHPDSICTRYIDPVVIDVAPSLVLDELVYLDFSKRYTGHYWLYDVMGKLLQTGEFKDDFYIVIGFEKYNYGMYFLQIEQEDKSYKTYKVIKQ